MSDISCELKLPTEWLQEIKELADKINWPEDTMLLSVIRCGINTKKRELNVWS